MCAGVGGSAGVGGADSVVSGSGGGVGGGGGDSDRGVAGGSSLCFLSDFLVEWWGFCGGGAGGLWTGYGLVGGWLRDVGMAEGTS